MPKGGKTYEARIKSSDVREKVLDAILAVYSGKEEKLSAKQWELTLRMATTVLPRLNELTGADGEELFPSPILNGLSGNNRNKKTPKAQEENS